MNISITPALIAAVVSLAVSLLTFISTRYGVASEKERQERELQRKLTERLYELRIACYPKAFTLTQPLLSERLFTDGITNADCTRLVQELDAWCAAESNFSMSRPSLKSFYALRDLLRQCAKPDHPIERDDLNRLTEAKNNFRASLVQDVQLLFAEDRNRLAAIAGPKLANGG